MAGCLRETLRSRPQEGGGKSGIDDRVRVGRLRFEPHLEPDARRVARRWNNAVVSTSGVVTQPDTSDANVTLTATIAVDGGFTVESVRTQLFRHRTLQDRIFA